jgi:galactose mutarotase-like enzyme
VSARVEQASLDGLAAVVLHDDDADLHATWLPGAGMLGASLVHRGAELLWNEPGASAYARAGVFQGIPFLHPWANRLAADRYSCGGKNVTLDPAAPGLKHDDNGLPIHGLLNASSGWRVAQKQADAHGARLRAVLDFDTPELLADFPFAHRVELDVVVHHARMRVTTTIAPSAELAVPLAFGFHPYLRLPGAPRAEWELDFPVRRKLLLDAQQIPTGATTPVAPISGPVGERTWDDGFDRIDEPRRFALRAAGRELAVEFEAGYDVAQIFVPPGADFVCVEPMTAPANALSSGALEWVQPGERFSATFSISCAARD